MGNTMRRLNTMVSGLVDGVLRLVRRPGAATAQRCTDCGAGVGQQCATPFCYGSLGDVPREGGIATDRAIKVMRGFTGQKAEHAWSDDRFADLIADLMHLARECGIDPYELLDQAGNYYTADVEKAGDVSAAVAR
jgi:hypothetical protein